MPWAAGNHALDQIFAGLIGRSQRVLLGSRFQPHVPPCASQFLNRKAVDRSVVCSSLSLLCCDTQMNGFASFNCDYRFLLAFDYERLVLSRDDMPNLGFGSLCETAKHNNQAQWYEKLSA